MVHLCHPFEVGKFNTTISIAIRLNICLPIPSSKYITQRKNIARSWKQKPLEI